MIVNFDFGAAPLLSLNFACVVLVSLVLRKVLSGVAFPLSQQIGREMFSPVSLLTRGRPWAHEVDHLGLMFLLSVMSVLNEKETFQSLLIKRL